MEQKNNKLIVVLLVILILLVAGLLSFLVYKELSDNRNNSMEQNIESTNTTRTTAKTNSMEYVLEKTDIIGKVIYHTEGTRINDIEDNEGNIRLIYPQIKSNNKELNDLNNKLKHNVEKNIDSLNEINLSQTLYDENNDKVCIAINMNKSSNKLVFEHFPYLTYKINDNDDILQIEEIEEVYTECASGAMIIENIYSIDKNTQKILKRDELKKEYSSNFDEIVNNFIEFITEKINNDKDVVNKQEIINEIKNDFENEKYIIRIKNNKLIFTFESSISEEYESYIFDNNNWQEENTFEY